MTTKEVLCPICAQHTRHLIYYRGVLALNDKPTVVAKCICMECKSHNIKYYSFQQYYSLITK